MIWPDARVVEDTTVDVQSGPSGWPPNPVVYGGRHVNRLMKAIAQGLPFDLDEGRLVPGEEIFDGGDYQLIAVVPGRPGGEINPGFPEFVIYAGRGTPGIGEINAVRQGSDVD